MKRPRRALRHDVRDGLVQSILDGEYGPGDRLVEMHIARTYGTSQGPVREALRELEMLGFVRSEPHRGTYVRDPWQRGMLELYEPDAAFAAQPGETVTGRDEIRAALAQLEQFLLVDDGVVAVVDDDAEAGRVADRFDMRCQSRLF